MEYTTAVVCDGVMRGGAAPFAIFKGCAGLSCMKNKLKRYYGRRDLHFITFSCYERRPLLGSMRARNLFVKVLEEVRERYRFKVVGYVLMPEHVRLLMSEPAKGTPSKIMQVLKQRVSRAMRGKRRSSSGQLRLPFAEERRERKRFWQRRFYDFNVWSRGKVKEKLNYMHANPVVRGVVKHPKNWPWSSWSFYENGEKGLIDIDPVD
jgi:putative transposase